MYVFFLFGLMFCFSLLFTEQSHFKNDDSIVIKLILGSYYICGLVLALSLLERDSRKEFCGKLCLQTIFHPAYLRDELISSVCLTKVIK